MCGGMATITTSTAPKMTSAAPKMAMTRLSTALPDRRASARSTKPMTISNISPVSGEIRYSAKDASKLKGSRSEGTTSQYLAALPLEIVDKTYATTTMADITLTDIPIAKPIDRKAFTTAA
jgi:hypothetical protein